MFDKLDIVLALVLAGVFAFLLYKMMSFDKHMDDSRENGQYSHLIYSHETSWQKKERDNDKLEKYGVVAGLMIICIIYTVLRLNGTIGNIFSFFF